MKDSSLFPLKIPGFGQGNHTKLQSPPQSSPPRGFGCRVTHSSNTPAIPLARRSSPRPEMFEQDEFVGQA